MIRNQWYVVLESREVGNKPIGVTRMGEKMIFWRDQKGHLSAAVDRCPHRGAALSLGKIQSDHIQCPFHGFEFESSGKCVLVPANGRKGVVPNALKLASYPTHEEHGLIWIWWGDHSPGDSSAPVFFENLDESFFYASAYDPWDAHYSRARTETFPSIELYLYPL